MKKNILRLFIVLYLIMGLSYSYGQVPKPPNGDGNAPDANNTPVGGGAPIGGGLVILVSVALAYGYVRYAKKKPEYTVEEEV